MISLIKDYKTAIFSIAIPIFMSILITLATLYTDNVVEKKKIEDHNARITALEINDLAQQKQLNKTELSVVNVENMLLKNENNEMKNREKIDRIDQNIFELLKTIKRR